MKHLMFFLMIICLDVNGQTQINSISIEPTGLLHWNIGVIEFDHPDILIQKYVENNWVTIYDWSVSWHQIVTIAGGKEIVDEHPPRTKSYISSTNVPVDKGINKFRIVLSNITPELFSNEVSIERPKASIKKLYSNGDFIHLNKFSNYVVRDSTGKVIKSFSHTNVINTTDLKEGLYYVNDGEYGISIYEK